jgi:hypothetical protein
MTAPRYTVNRHLAKVFMKYPWLNSSMRVLRFGADDPDKGGYLLSRNISLAIVENAASSSLALAAQT